MVTKYLLAIAAHLIVLGLLIFGITFWALQPNSLADYINVFNMDRLSVYRLIHDNGTYYQMVSYSAFLFPLLNLIFSIIYLKVSLSSQKLQTANRAWVWVVWFSHVLVYLFISIFIYLALNPFAKLGIRLLGEDMAALGYISYAILGLILYVIISVIMTRLTKKPYKNLI